MCELPRWLLNAEKLKGTREIPGPRSNKKISLMLDIADGKTDGKTVSNITDDDIPWCATFVSAVLESSGIISKRTAWARSYLSFGTPLDGPAVGAIVVLARGKIHGHVGFIRGKNENGKLVVLGGNQSNMVRLSEFDKSRVLGYRWPHAEAQPEIGMEALPIFSDCNSGFPSEE